MTNEDFLNEKFCMSIYGKKEWLYEAKAAYLLKQMNWIENSLTETYQVGNGQRNDVVVRYLGKSDAEYSATGSCLLEAIENAQKGMANV